MKIRFYICGIVCVFLTCSFASAEWARFSDYENNGGCGFDTCKTDKDCNDGQCHFCDLSSGTNGNGICKKGSKYDGEDYGSYEKCKCVSRKREWATTENKCCPKGEYNSDGHCCPISDLFLSWNPKSNRCDNCRDAGEGELTCGDTEDTVFKCQNGSLVPVEICFDVGMAHRKCENGKCVCSAPPTCDKDRVLNADTCQCECPKDKPFWNGFFCTNRECETAGDCTSIFSDAVEACLRCENNQCKIKTGNICSTDGYVVQTCTADGKISPVSRPCDDNKKCVNGECVCDTEHPMCKVGETKCSEDEKSALECVTYSDDCPTWLTHNCAGEKGTGKCVDGKCEYDDCTPGETRCAPDFPEYAIQTCDDTKKWGGITFRKNKCFVCKDGKFENAYAPEELQKECECQVKNLKWCPNTKSCSLENGECPPCAAGYVWDTSDEAKASSSGNGAGACCPETNWNTTYNVCCNGNLSFWEHGYNITCAKAWCKKLNGSWSNATCCSTAKDGTDVNGTMTEACCKAANGSVTSYGCCSASGDGKDVKGTFTEACCNAIGGTWKNNECSFTCTQFYTAACCRADGGTPYKNNTFCCPSPLTVSGDCCTYRDGPLAGWWCATGKPIRER